MVFTRDMSEIQEHVKVKNKRIKKYISFKYYHLSSIKKAGLTN